MGISSILKPQRRDSAGPISVLQYGWTAKYVVVLVVGFTLLYVPTRSSIPIGDSETSITMAREGDTAEMHYGDPSHFLQVPLTRLVWQLLNDPFGLPISAESVLRGFSLIGTLAAIVFLGLIAAELLKTEAAAWLAALLFGTTLHSWTQWNGELYGLGLGFVTAGLFLALRGHTIAAALLWALSALSHSEFAVAAPVFVMAAWIAQPGFETAQKKMRCASALLVLAGTTTVLLLLAGSWLIGSWHDTPSFVAWLSRSYGAREGELASSPEVIRAAKGLTTAYSVAGHYWRDILTGRGTYGHPLFIPASVIGLLVLVTTGLFIAAASWHRRLMLFALLWLLPGHVLFNWWIVPTVEKYHGPALPGFVLLVTGGLIYFGARLRPRSRYALYAGYVATCAGLNLFGAVLPIQTLGTETSAAEREIRQLAEQRDGNAVFVSCDNPMALVKSGVPFLRVRQILEGSVPDIQRTILTWTRARIREGHEPYLLDRWCLPEEWDGPFPTKEPFDLFFLERYFQIVPTRITAVPVAHSPQTSPFAFRRGDVFRLDPRNGSR